MTTTLRTAELAVLATSDSAELSGGPPKLAGFIASDFSPLVAEVSRRCLSRRFGSPPAPLVIGDRTAVVLVSRTGDMATNAAVARSVDSGRPTSPLLFFQSVPNVAAGYVAKEWGLRGPVVCVSPVGDQRADGLDLAELLLAEGNVDLVLLVLIEQALSEGEHDGAQALLVGRPGASS